MLSIIDTCDHSSEILDMYSGDYVCTLCGLVLGRYYSHARNVYKQNKLDFTNNVNYNFIAEIMSKLNLPPSLSKSICAKVGEGRVKDSEICQTIYEVLIEQGIPFTLNEITSVSGVSREKIKSNADVDGHSVCILEEKKLLERCCSRLGLSYKDYTLIKKCVNDEMSGVNPSTVIAAHIYKYCKENRYNLKLKLITEVVGVSSMSVHRYLRRK